MMVDALRLSPLPDCPTDDQRFVVRMPSAADGHVQWPASSLEEYVFAVVSSTLAPGRRLNDA